MTLQTMSFIFGALLLAVGILGGGFEVKEIKVSNVTTSARIAAAIAGIVFIVLGFWEPNLNPLAPAVSTGATKAPSATMAMGPREEDTDRFGSDYKSFAVETGHTETCENACSGEERCLAWTYVKPGIQTQMARCWLKEVVPASSSNVCCVSGTKTRPN